MYWKVLRNTAALALNALHMEKTLESRSNRDREKIYIKMI